MKSLIKFFYSKNFLSSHESIDIQLYSFNLHPRGGRGGGLGVPTMLELVLLDNHVKWAGIETKPEFNFKIMPNILFMAKTFAKIYHHKK